MKAGESVTNLRLPVPFFDLLMVLLVTCLVFVAPLPVEGEKIEALDISIAQGKSKATDDHLLPVIPRHTGGAWTFESEGRALSPAELRSTANGRKVVLVVPPATAIQEFVDMQTAMGELGIPFALAIKHKETAP